MKGQISFDVLMTGVVLLVLLGTLGTVAGFAGNAQKSTAIRMDGKRVLSEISDLMISAWALEDATNGSSIEYLIPKIFVPGEEKQDCTITSDGSFIYLTVTGTGIGTIVEKIQEPKKSENLDYTLADCGNTMKIERL